MDAIKVENFRRANPNAAFPQFAPVPAAACLQLRMSIAERIGLKKEAEPLEILGTLWERATVLPDINAEDEMPLQKLIPQIDEESYVFVNWYRFDSIDRFAMTDFEAYFDELWYPSSDDIEVFDASLRWFLLVRHDGRVGRLCL
jgi:hypothetical protein